MNQTLEGQVIWVTGSAVRVGKAISLELAKYGAHLVIHYHTSHAQALETAQMIRNLGREAMVVGADLTQPDQIYTAVETIESQMGRLDALVNNASIFIRTPWEMITPNDWDTSLAINLKAPVFCALESAKLMLKTLSSAQAVKDPTVCGRIINLIDWAAMRPFKNYLPYMIAKGGLVTMTKALAIELAPKILVNAIAPGPVLPEEGASKEMVDKMIQRVPLQRLGSVEAIAHTVRFFLESPDYITGQILSVDGGRSLG